MEDRMNPSIPYGLAKKLGQEKENAFTLYWDFVVDGTASMSSLYPAVFFAVGHFLEWLKRYDVKPVVGITVIRSMPEEKIEKIEMEPGSYFTEDVALFLKKLKYLPLFGGSEDGEESVEEALLASLEKFPPESLNRGMMVFTDSHHCSHHLSLRSVPVGAVTFFCPPEMSFEEFDFAFCTPDGLIDEEGSPAFIDICSLFEELKPEYLDNVVKPFKDLIQGVSIGV
ncbi:MAG: hypothetical protein Q4B70_13075 [Lachnospiraceae bacterium]|nr:hypothetical protein [Lachnospiraceae bacterium]